LQAPGTWNDVHDGWSGPAVYEFSATPPTNISASQKSSIDILEATTNKAVRFRINDPPSGNDAWVGIYPVGSEDSDYGEEGVRWHWLREIDVNNAWFPEKSEGHWSIRVFSDGGVTPDQRVDFDITPKKERWWEG